PRNYHQDRLSPDGTQLFYLEPNPTTGLNDLWRLDVLTGDQRLIRANIGDVVNYEIAPDSQHVVLAYPDYHLVYLDVASGAMWTLLDTPPFPTNFYDVVGWMHRFESTWQPSRLLVVDLALLIIGLIPRRLLQLRHTPPRSGRQNDAMPRLLKLATLLMGLLLLVVTVGLGSRRQTPFDDYVPVVMQPRQNDGTTRLVQVWSGSGAVLPITPGYVQDAQTLGVFDDGTTYAYAVGWHDYSVVDYMRASPNAPQGQRIVRNALYGSIMVSPDGKWVLYRQSDPSTGQPFVALNVETGQEWNITEIVRPVRVAFQGMHAFSRDGEWLFVSAVEASSIPKSRLMRIRLSDGTSETLPPAVTLPRTISILGQVGDWMMVLMEDRVYRQSIHQPIFEPLLTDTPVAQNSEYWLGGYDDLGVALLMRERHVLGVEVASRKILWAYTDLSLSLDSATKQGWMIGAYQSGFARIHLVTGEIQTPDWTTDAPGAYVLAQTTVDQWLIYAQWDDNDIMEWRRMNWVTHEDSLIRGNMYDANFIALSPDGRWILLTHSDGLYRLNVQDGSFQLLLPDQDFAMLAGWTRPFTRAWQPLALIAIAVALITLSILPRRLLQLMHRNPSSL
ncbi:MAG: hypothetical protein K8L91_28835, partial [Anaerolineae bacterium]|nr:hypothetical protein [Anaerolineae bacterium]